MKIAVVGTGIAGNVASYYLSKEHDVTVFEANDYIGGHSHTHDLQVGGETIAVDSGFIVFNHKTYPGFVKLLRELQVPWQESDMSFSVHCERNGFEYNGTSLNTLFAQRSNFLRPGFYRMLKNVLRFNREAVEFLKHDKDAITLGEFLRDGGYSQKFVNHYILPMGAAIWSTTPGLMLEFPARFFIRFFHHHGMLSVDDRPQWYVIKNGSRSYVQKLAAPFANNVRLSTPVNKVWRYHDRVEIDSKNGRDVFDCVFFACHSDQALKILADSSPNEQRVLGAMPYQPNLALLHSDASVMPDRKLAWASWNYRIPGQDDSKPVVTYYMNRLQRLATKKRLFVTLNAPERVDESCVYREMVYHHPLFTRAGIAAQSQQSAINGHNRSFYVGAYWGYGFHEDGVASAMQALEHFNEWQSCEQLSVYRAN